MRKDPRSNVGLLFGPGRTFGKSNIVTVPPVVSTPAVTLPNAAGAGKANVHDPFGALAPRQAGAEVRGPLTKGDKNVVIARLNFGSINGNSIPIAVPFTIRSVRLWGVAGGAYVFTNTNIATPPALDGNGLPVDPSFIGSAKQGTDATFLVPTTGISSLLFAQILAANAANTDRKALSALHLYPLADAGATALDIAGGSNGSYGATAVFQQQPAIAPDELYSVGMGIPPVFGANNDPGFLSLPFGEVNNGKDFSIEFIWKKITPATNLWDPFLYDNSDGSGHGFIIKSHPSGASGQGITVGLSSTPSGGGALGAWFWTSNDQLALGLNHLVVCVSVTTGSWAAYLNGSPMSFLAGPGAPAQSNFGTYAPSVATQSTFGNAQTRNSSQGTPGYYQSLTMYPSQLTTQQVFNLYQTAVTGLGSQNELLATITDEVLSPGTYAIP